MLAPAAFKPAILTIDRAEAGMTAQPFDPAGFAPEDLVRMAAAYAGALTIASDGGSPFATIPVDDLRLRLAREIMREARLGVRDTNQLRARALRRLRL